MSNLESGEHDPTAPDSLAKPKRFNPKVDGRKPRKHPGGRPTLYNKKLHPMLGKLLAEQGMTDEQISSELGVSTQTYYNWQNKYREFLESIRDGKENKDAMVENALFQRATGVVVKAQKPVVVSQGQGLGSVVELVEYEDRMPPDPTSMIFYLKNRRPDRWRDKQELEHSGDIGIVPMTREERAARIAKLEEELGKKGERR